MSLVMTESAGARRPLKSRQTGWAKTLAQFLVKSRISPNAISIASVFFAIGAGVAFYFASPDKPIRYMQMLVIAAVAIQGRLLCNLLDGLVAVEGGLQTKSGQVCNELPGTISAALVFIPVGACVHKVPFC